MPIQPSFVGSGEPSGIGVSSAFSPFTKPKSADKVQVPVRHTVSELKLIDNAAAEAPTGAKEVPGVAKGSEERKQ